MKLSEKSRYLHTKKEIKICLSQLHSHSDVTVLVSVARTVGCSPKPFFCFPQGWNYSQASAAHLDSLSPPPRKLDVSKWCGCHHGTWAELTWSIHRPGGTWGRVLCTLFPPDGWNLHSQPPSINQWLWWYCPGRGTQGKERRPPLAPPTLTMWCKRELQPFVFLATCCCVALLQQFSLTIMVCFLLFVLLWGVLFLTFHGPLSDQGVQVHYLIPQQYLLKVKWKLLSCVWFFATPWTIQSMKFSKPECWSG